MKSKDSWFQEKETKFLTLSFTSTTENLVLHSFFKYQNSRYNSLSSVEVSRLKNKSGDKFQHHWIMDESLSFCKKTGVNWLIYLGGDGIFLFALYRKYNSSNSQNKRKNVNVQPLVSYKRKTVEDHANSQLHKNAVMAEILSRMYIFHKEIEKKLQRALCTITSP